MRRHHLLRRQHPHRRRPPRRRQRHTRPSAFAPSASRGDRIVLTGTNDDRARLRRAHTRKRSTSTAPSPCPASTTRTPTSPAPASSASPPISTASPHSPRCNRASPPTPKTLDDPAQWILGGGWDHTKWAIENSPHAPGPRRRHRRPPRLPRARRRPHRRRQHRRPQSRGHRRHHTQTPPAATSTATPRANPPASSAKRPHARSSKDTSRRPASTRAAKLSSSPSSDALAHGVTSVQDFSTWDDWLVLEGLERDNKLPLRVYEWIDFNLPVGALKQRRASHDLQRSPAPHSACSRASWTARSAPAPPP